MIILIDADNVLFDFLSHSLATCAEFSDKFSTPEAMADGYYHQLLPDGDPVTDAVWAKVNSTPGWVASMPVFEHAAEMLDQLRQCGELVAVTSAAYTMPTWGYERAHALYKLGFATNQIIQTSRKDLVYGHVFIDDHPKHIESWSKFWRLNSLTLWEMQLAILWLDKRFRRPTVNEMHSATHDFKIMLNWIVDLKEKISSRGVY